MATRTREKHKKKASIRLGLIGPLPPPSGGMANQTQQLADLLTSEGVSVEVIRVNESYKPACVGKIKGVRAVFRLLPYTIRLWRTAERVDLFHIMANSGWSWHLYATPAITIGTLRGIPVIVNYRGGGADSFLRRSKWVVKPVLSKASAIVVPSSFLLGIFDKYGLKARIVPNIINLERFYPGNISVEFGAHEDLENINTRVNKSSISNKRLLRPKQKKPHIVVTRNLEQIYDISTALRAFQQISKRYPYAHMTIAGDGPEKQSLQALARGLGISESTTFTGRLGNEKVAELYRNADIMLNPSLIDNMPISILEALASGVPVVSANVGGVPHMVENGLHALLVPPGNHSAAAEALQRVIEDSALAAKLSNAGLAFVRQFSWPQVRSRWMEIYNELIEPD